MKIKDIVKCDSKGRVVVPQSIREELSVNPGDKFDIILSDDDLIVLSKRVPEEREFKV